MSALSFIPLLWAQIAAPGRPRAGCGRRSAGSSSSASPPIYGHPALLGGADHLAQGGQPVLPAGLGRLLADDRAQGADDRPRELARHRRPGRRRRRRRRPCLLRVLETTDRIAGRTSVGADLARRAARPGLRSRSSSSGSSGPLADDPPARAAGRPRASWSASTSRSLLGAGRGVRDPAGVAASSPTPSSRPRPGRTRSSTGSGWARRTWATSSWCGWPGMVLGEVLARPLAPALRDRQAERRSSRTGGCGPPGS